jgi:hypothetical protein
MDDARDTSGLPDILKPENLPPEFKSLNPEAHEVQAQTTAPAVNSLAWMRDVSPDASEEGVPAELRDTPPSGEVSQPPLDEGQPFPSHHQPGVSPGNAEAEDPDWDHLGG